MPRYVRKGIIAICIIAVVASIVFVKIYIYAPIETTESEEIVSAGDKDSISEMPIEIDKPTVDDSNFVDPRDERKYKIVQIGNRVWMAENLNYKSANSWCYANKDSNCDKYGRLYNWEAARKACPAGWHLPKREEWIDLHKAIEDEKPCIPKGRGGLSKEQLVKIRREEHAGKKLKSKSQWNGTDDYGFSALPGGMRYHTQYNNSGAFLSLGSIGYYWSDHRFDKERVYFWTFRSNNDEAHDALDYNTYGLSVRCVNDEPVPDNKIKESERPNKQDNKPECKK